jgi:large subunit ribosomal protein L25
MATHQKTYEISVQPRTVLGKKSKTLRKQHVLPAVLYGYGVESTPLMVDQKEMERVYLHAGSISLVDLRIGEGGTARKVFIHNVQRNPVTHMLIHVDFMAINLTEAITSSVPLVLVGEAPAVSQREGMLMQALDHIQVRALPADLPPMVEVDISGLEAVDDAIHVSDLKLASNVQVLTNEDELIAKINALPVQVEEAAEEEAPEAGEEAGEEASTASSPEGSSG